MSGPASTVPGLAPTPTSPVLAALLPHAVLLAFVITGSLDLAAFTFALAIEAALYGIFTKISTRKVTDEGATRLFPVVLVLVIALGAWLRTDWTLGNGLSVLGVVATAALALAHRCRRSGVVFGAVRGWEYALRIASAALALALLLGSETFVRLTDAGWRPGDADVGSWLGARMMQLGETLGLSPEVTLTATLVLFFGVVEALWLSVRGVPAPPAG